jgi:hypothetical protein
MEIKFCLNVTTLLLRQLRESSGLSKAYQMKQNIKHNAEKGLNMYSIHGGMPCHTVRINLLGQNGQ